MNQGIKVAVLDDGIFQGKYCLPSLQWNIKVQNGILEDPYQCPQPHRVTSHGTVCAAIIHHYAPQVQLSSVKVIFGEQRTGSPDDLIAGIDWCLTHQMDLVHLSIGTVESRDFPKLGRKIHEAVKRGLVFVAAQSNTRRYTYPACLADVIGVRQRPIYHGSQYRMNLDALNGVEILASSAHALPLMDGGVQKTPICNSFAAPLITAKAANLMAKSKCSLSKEALCLLLSQEEDCLARAPYDPYFQAINYDYPIQQVDVLSPSQCDEVEKHGEKAYFVFTKALTEQQRERMCRLKKRYFDPGEYEKRFLRKRTEGKTEIPMISFATGNLEKDQQLAERMERAVYDQSYYPAVLSPYPQDSGRGWFYCPPGSDGYPAACTIAKELRPDILILCSSAEPRADIRVRRQKDSFVVISEEGEYACTDIQQVMRTVCGLVFEDE